MSSVRICNGTLEDIHEYREDFKNIIKFRDQCRPSFQHKSRQSHCRKYAVGHIAYIASEKELTHCSIQLAVYILDIFMDSHNVTAEQLPLLANTCLLIAAKLEENSTTTPKITELNSFVNCRYTPDDYKNLEIVILKFFDWYVMFPTPAQYTYYYLQMAITYDDISFKKATLRELLLELLVFIRKYLNRIIEDIHYMQCFAPSQLAAAIISSARISIELSSWTVELQNLTDYTDNDIKYIRHLILQPKPLICTYCDNVCI